MKTNRTKLTVTLPDGFILRLQKCKRILEEVESKTLEEILNDCLEMKDPETELLVYEKIAKEYKEWLKVFPKMTLSQKKDTYLDLLWESI